MGSYPYRPGFHARDISKRISQRLASFRMPARARYRPHPDQNQENFFVALLREAIEQGEMSKEFVADEIQKRNTSAPISLELVGNGSQSYF